MGVPLTGTFDSATETLTITYNEREQGGADRQQPTAGSAAGRRRSFQQQQQQDSSSAGDSQQQEQPSSAQLGLNNEQFNLKLWLDHMQGKIINRQHIPKADVPLQVRLAGDFVGSFTACHLHLCKWLQCSLFVQAWGIDLSCPGYMLSVLVPSSVYRAWGVFPCCCDADQAVHTVPCGGQQLQ